MAKIKPKFYGVAKGGKVILNDRETFDQHVAQFLDDQELEMTVERRWRRRSQKAPGEVTNFNGYYWGVIIKTIADTLGYIGREDYDMISDWVQINIGNFKVMPDGKKVAGQTHAMSGGEFSEMCSRARMWANIPGNVCEKGLFLPEPHQVDYE
jgi:hypothetical protein